MKDICPWRISQRLLDTTGRALTVGDFRSFHDCLCLPVVVTTTKEKRAIDKPSDLREVFERVRWHRKKYNSLAKEREILYSAFFGHHTVLSVHSSSMRLSDSVVETSPLQCLSQIQFDGMSWRITEMHYDTENNSDFSRALNFQSS